MEKSVAQAYLTLLSGGDDLSTQPERLKESSIRQSAVDIGFLAITQGNVVEACFGIRQQQFSSTNTIATTTTGTITNDSCYHNEDNGKNDNNNTNNNNKRKTAQKKKNKTRRLWGWYTETGKTLPSTKQTEEGEETTGSFSAFLPLVTSHNSTCVSPSTKKARTAAVVMTQQQHVKKIKILLADIVAECNEYEQEAMAKLVVLTYMKAFEIALKTAQDDILGRSNSSLSALWTSCFRHGQNAAILQGPHLNLNRSFFKLHRAAVHHHQIQQLQQEQQQQLLLLQHGQEEQQLLSQQKQPVPRPKQEHADDLHQEEDRRKKNFFLLWTWGVGG